MISPRANSLLALLLAISPIAALAQPMTIAPPSSPAAVEPVPLTSSKDTVPFVFSTPSDEMDFNIKPVPAAQFGYRPPAPSQPTVAPPEPAPFAIATPPGSPAPAPAPAAPVSGVPISAPGLPTDSDNVPFDQFFSTTTVLEPEPEPVAPAIDQEPVAAPAGKTRKKVARPRFLRAGPTFTGFHSVRLPEPIYSKNYSRPNLGLPIAVWESDMQGMLALAVARGRTEDLRALIRQGADMNLPTSGGESLVVLGTRFGQADTVRWLLQHGANPNEADSGGLTALHYAAYRNDHVVTNLLLQYGGDYTATNARGVTPLQIAELRGATGAGEVLRRAGANG